MQNYDMSKSNFVYRMTRLDGIDKEGVIKPDSDGWYTVCIGALDHASKNINPKTGQAEYYGSQGYEQFFAPGTLFNDRIQGGFIKAEYGHPEREPGMSDVAFLERNMQIREKNVCAVFGAIWLVHDFVDPLTKEKCVGIFAKIKPTGPYGKFLENDLLTKGVNVCFSIRSLTTRKVINGRNTKVLHTVITFDFVTEPGITCAEKFVSPSMESAVPQVTFTEDVRDVEVSAASARRLIERSNISGLSTESGVMRILKEVAQEQKGKPSIKHSFDW